MSENMGSSESAVEETASSQPTEPAQPESVSPPTGKDGKKKKMLIMVVAIIVVAALIGTAVYVMVIAGPKLKAEISPSPIPDVAAGTSVALSIEVMSGSKDVTGDATLDWSVSPATLGSFNVYAQPSVVFTAGDAAGEGTISCEVEYDGKTITVEEPITVEPPFLDSVTIVPSSKSLDIDEEWTFNATAYDSVGDPVIGATFSWTVTGIDAGDYTLSATTGASVVFSASVQGNATLGVTATDGTDTVSGSATVSVGTDFPKSVDYYWDDMFNHPLGEWYDIRIDTSNEWAIHDESYPYLYIWEGPPAGNIWIYTFMRMDMDARNLTEVNMNDNPEFLPLFSDSVSGGTAVLDWYLNYVTLDECIGKLTGPQIAWYDGWYVAWNGTVTLDETAARGVLDITSTEFDNFDTWWSVNADSVAVAWENWLMYEAGPQRLAIFNMYEWDLQFVWFDMTATKPDADHIELTFDTISWGMEALMTRWMHEAWMSTEWYFEDMNFLATIGPERADITVDTAIQYAVYAYEDTLDSKPCWCWEALMQDYVESPSEEYPDSLFELYVDFEYLNWAPGSDWYGDEMPYDYAPGAWNLTEGEKLTIEWPAGEQMFFVHDPGYDGETLVPNTRQVYDNMTVRYAEPMPSDTDTCEIDLANRQIIYTGPFDMWTWSKDQTAHDWLADEWDRMEILPYGIPFIEFVTATEEEGYDIEVEVLTDPVEVGEPATVSVTIVTEITREVVEDYAGTVTFETDDTSAVLPANYTFVPATDMGVHEFTVTFNTVDPVTHEATYYLTVSDVDDSLVSGTASDILVVELPTIASFDVEFTSATPVIAEEPTSVTVTAMNQWDEVYTDYEGTVTFASDDTGATLPADTPYTLAMDGVQTFSVTFSTDGNFYVNVSDVAVPEASGETATDVLPAAEADYFELTPGRNPARTDDPPDTMTVTVYDQYDREFEGYEGTVTFTTNRSGDVTLPADTPFTLGDSDIVVDITYLVDTTYWINCSDDSDSTINGSVTVRAVSGVEVVDHLTVEGIEDMWENNYSSVTVSVINQWDTVFVGYDGEIAFETNAPSGATLPAAYTFNPGVDHGVKEFADSVSFDDPGTFNVTAYTTADPTINGTQEDIDIEDLVADWLEVTGAPTTIMENDTFTVVVTVYHQHDMAFVEYDGTVEFETSDDSGFAVLPTPYEFQPADAGEHAFTGELSLSLLGSQTVTVTDDADGTITDTVTIEVTPFVTSELTYTVYDFFGEPWGEWWDDRPYGQWDTDRLLTSDEGNVTTLYAVTGTPKSNSNDQGMIYAPYRWNIAGVDLPNVDVHAPEFMMIPDGSTPVAGAEASTYIYFQYLYDDWWTSFWLPTWGDHPDWDSAIGDGLVDDQDGWIVGTYYEVTMNREAALEWLGMPLLDNPATWWGTYGDDYLTDWKDWIDIEGNDRLDIYNGYEYTYIDMGTLMMLSGDATTVTLEIAHMSWGYEALMTRWLAESGLSALEVYYEDFEMTVDYREDEADVDMDAVCQWSLHCSQSTSAGDTQCAWVWEPYALDYIRSSTQHPDSDFDPYYPLTYLSGNCGDPKFGTQVAYEATPTKLSLPSYAKLVVQLPDYDVIGYQAEAVGLHAMYEVWTGDTSDYDAIRYTGAIGLGYANLNGLTDYTWDAGTKTLTLNGPWDFDNPHPTEEGLLLHGAPWIEFDVAEPPKLAASSAVVPGEVVSPGLANAEEQVSVSTAASAAGEVAMMAAVMAAVLLMLAALAMGAGRRRLDAL